MTNEERQMQEAEQFAQRLSRRPIEEQIAVGCISKNVLNGCSWEFVRKNRDIERNLEAFKHSKVCSCQTVCFDPIRKDMGYLVYMKIEALLQILSTDAPGLIEMKDLERASRHHQEAVLKLAKVLSDKPYKGKIGIYCTNDSPTITIRGTTLPAFSVTLREFLQVCTKTGYGVSVMDKIRTPEEIWSKADAFLSASTVAPSGNAILLNIAPLR